MDTVLTGTPELDQMQFDYEVAETAVESTTKSVRQAMAAAQARIRDDLAAAEDQSASLSGVIDGVADAIEKVAVARGSAKVAAYHAPSVKLQGDDIVAAIKQIASWERGLLKLQSEAQAMQAGMDKALDVQWKVVFAFHEQVNEAEKFVKQLQEDGASMKAALESTKEQALKRVEMRNPDGLELQQQDARRIDIKQFKALLGRFSERHDEALVLFDKVGAKAQEGRKADLAELKRVRAAAEKCATELQALQQAILALKAEPVDVAKALKVLGLPSQHKTALAQALAKPTNQREKALDELAKQAKVAMKGKAWLQALERAKVV
jgi:hypothetical protein